MLASQTARKRAIAALALPSSNHLSQTAAPLSPKSPSWDADQAGRGNGVTSHLKRLGADLRMSELITVRFRTVTSVF